MTIVIKINEDNFIIVDTCFTSFVIFMKVCKQKCIEGIEFEIKNNVKKSLDKKIKDKKSVSKIVDKYTTELQNCYNVKNVSFDQFIYPESTNNLELKKCVAAECAGERSWWET